MDPISKLSKLLETIRSQQAASGRSHAKKVSDSNGINHSTDQAKSTAKLQSKLTVQQLSHRISDRLNHLPSTERHGSKAIQVFVDSVLAWEFGDEFLQGDSFSKYSVKVREVIANDKNLSQEFEVLLKSLVAD